MNERKPMKSRFRVGYRLAAIFACGAVVAMGGLFRREITWFLLDP